MGARAVSNGGTSSQRFVMVDANAYGYLIGELEPLATAVSTRCAASTSRAPRADARLRVTP